MRGVCFFFSLLIFLGFFGSAEARKPFKKGTFIRDTEVEAILRGYIAPIFKAAGLNPQNLRLFLIVNPELNASASTRYSIFMNTGLIMKAKSAGEVIGVLAHETGHIAGNHLAGREGAARKSSLAAMATMALGAAVIVAGGGEAGSGILMGGQHMATQNFFHYNRGQEAAADQAAARYLDSLRWPSEGLLTFMEVLEQQELLSTRQQDAYVRTHPFTGDRVSFLRHHVGETASRGHVFPRHFDPGFERMRVKLKAFLEPPIRTLTEYPESDRRVIARYARAIALHYNDRSEDAVRVMEELLREVPDDPYFWELKGQILFESAKIPEAIKAYGRALALKPDAPLIRLGLAFAMVESGNPAYQKEMTSHLKKVLEVEKDSPMAWRLLATAYGRQKRVGLASYALAEEAFARGRYDVALDRAKRALHHLSKGSSQGDEKAAILKATDIQKQSQRNLSESGSARRPF